MIQALSLGRDPSQAFLSKQRKSTVPKGCLINRVWSPTPLKFDLPPMEFDLPPMEFDLPPMEFDLPPIKARESPGFVLR